MWLALACVAFWPVWRWVLSRLTDGTAEGAGVVSWGAAIALLAGKAQRDGSFALPATSAGVWIATSLVLVYAASVLVGVVPPIVRAGLALTAIAAIGSTTFLQRPFSAPLWSLLLLGLPLEASLQFYAGYPLRFVSTEIAACMLRAMSLGVEASGTRLVYGATEVIVDAPCSGLSALRVGLIACSALLLARGRGTRDWVVACALTTALAVIGNAVRSASLFLSETHRIAAFDSFGEWLHPAIGVVIFAAVLGAQAWSIDRGPRLVRSLGGAP